MASLNVGNLGDYLREQRRNAQLSLRQLADAAGVSNPYLSQIERGLRKPSAEVLQQVAKALRISAETLYVRAGILDAERDRDEVETRAVILADPTLNERQKQVLLQIYESFRKENGFGTGDGSGNDTDVVEVVVAEGAADPGADGDADEDVPDGGTGIRRRTRTADGGRPAEDRTGEGSGGTSETRRTRKTTGGTSATRRTRKNTGGTPAARRARKATGGSDTDPQQTAG
ncbi:MULTISPECIES: helix-turn-helix domain-containing protein [Streptomyces]|uniref:Helix-turn-helix domain-containing protein n=1 Tax=Streptomyces koelreuteriae TaxID=2838015 RepID=A0ABX8FU81_9ACTN|nr:MULTISPECIES: helix-turn-helix transcriptional regulator [Streptomyces]QWB24756.1 helix-turn-helix domain-containing protein [Streptomyces koelreuteriae]UUA07768.1 helix-turn-helix domain-containing protein [Streptomyces koelreuteriae]UUA15397.1 helix-turn-helix domain-containing protein [Streptomyces sp. CRCS-T-1]